MSLKTNNGLSLTGGESVISKRAHNGVVAFLDGTQNPAMFMGQVHMAKAKSISPHAAHVTIVQFVSDGLWSASLLLSVVGKMVQPMDVLRELQAVTQRLPNNQLDRYELSCIVADYFYNMAPSQLSRVYAFVKSDPMDRNENIDDVDYYVHEAFARYGETHSNAFAKLGPCGDLVTTLDESERHYQELTSQREGSLLMRYHPDNSWGLACFDNEDFHEIGRWLSDSRLGRSPELEQTTYRDSWKRPVFTISFGD